ncbi:hypothetical protein DFJ73DRAFT_770034 [Zopfochytrium polystomum]|nr:hypothetical protein DFJ73DRAFT_770034 [Zopfochytrium polystomum]
MAPREANLGSVGTTAANALIPRRRCENCDARTIEKNYLQRVVGHKSLSHVALRQDIFSLAGPLRKYIRETCREKINWLESAWGAPLTCLVCPSRPADETSGSNAIYIWDLPWHKKLVWPNKAKRREGEERKKWERVRGGCGREFEARGRDMGIDGGRKKTANRNNVIAIKDKSRLASWRLRGDGRRWARLQAGCFAGKERVEAPV